MSASPAAIAGSVSALTEGGLEMAGRQFFPKPIIITGADGYLGRRLISAALDAGWQVTALTRHPPFSDQGYRRVCWSLGDTLPFTALHPIAPPALHTIIHLAHDWRVQPGDDEAKNINLVGTRVLRQSAHSAGIGRFVFVSSQSARADATNVYGRLKWLIEKELAERDVAARLGLVYGGPARAMYGLLCRLTLLPVLPMIDPERPVQPIHLDEACQGLLRLANGIERGLVGLAAPVGVPFRTFLGTLAHELYGRRLRIVPIPLWLVLRVSDFSRILPGFPSVDRERILGLAGTRAMDCAVHLQDLGLTARPLETALRCERVSRKTVLAEGRALMRFVLSAPPGNALLRRYARAVMLERESGPLQLSPLLRTFPSLIRLVEPFNPLAALSQRLALATALAEASPDGERALGAVGRWQCIGRLACDLTLDAMALPARVLSSLWRCRP